MGSIQRCSPPGGLSICELLHQVNAAIGMEGELLKNFPECIEEASPQVESSPPEWLAGLAHAAPKNVGGRDDFFMPELQRELEALALGEGFRLLNDFDPRPLKNMAADMGLEHFTEELGVEEYRVSFFRPPGSRPAREVDSDEAERDEADSEPVTEDGFEILNVVGMKEDPFQIIMKKAQTLGLGEGFILVQSFKPDPLIRMLEGMGFEHEVAQTDTFRFRITFTKTSGAEPKKSDVAGDTRVPVVLQSATPVVWPVLMRMMQSERLASKMRFDEVKVWDETEKHMAWIMKGKADISFSALVAAAKLYMGGADIRMASVDVWDNFYLLSRNGKVKSFADLKGRTLRLPLIKAAPPYAVTSYLMKASGYDPAEFDFAFGKPFGRPEELKDGFIKGDYDAVLLREPEASYALFAVGADANSLSYSDLWRELHPEAGLLPNAGLVFKGEFLRNHPDLAKLFIEELKDAVEWVSTNAGDAAKLSFDIMRHKPEEVELFLSRVHLEHRPVAEVKDSIVKYLGVLVEEGGMKISGNLSEAMGIFEGVE
jgi:NitT/TauT family transport system substrate-binding protein